jgi:hypothetical protein
LTVSCTGGGSGTVSANNGSVNTVAGYFAAAGSTTVAPFAGLTFASNNLQIPSGGVYQISTDVGLSRGAAGFFDVGTGAAASMAGFVKTAQSIMVTGANRTCGTGGTSDPCRQCPKTALLAESA